MEKHDRQTEKNNKSGDGTSKSGREAFLVRVLYQENATWQGTVTWVDGKKTYTFRSELELIRLMDSILTQNRSKNEEVNEIQIG